MGKPMSYFDNMIKNYGENWLVAMSPESIQKYSNRIVKDMVKGTIDYEKYGRYFLDGKFIDNLMVAINNDYEISSLHYNALLFYQQAYPNTPNLSIHINHDYALMIVYQTILAKLQQVKMDMNIGWLADTSAVLYQYRNHLN